MANAKKRRRVRLIHWNVGEATKHLATLRAAGYKVEYELPTNATLRQLRQDPPDAIVIDLSRLPAQGRDMGITVRHHKSTRRVPLVFVAGEPKKVAGIKKMLPDAVYTTWSRIRGSLKGGIANPPEDPVAFESQLAGYSGTPLPKKLGIKPSTVVALIGAPQGFEETLGALPDGVTLRHQARGKPDLLIWFVKSRKELERRIERLGGLAGKGGLWVAWPKKASGASTDVSETIVRKRGLAVGLVDYKICAIDHTWSGLRFARRKSK